MKYFTPLLPPVEIFHSKRSSKSVKSRSVMRSPPPPFATWVSQPSFTIHPCSGKVALPNPRQPAVDLPSKRAIHGIGLPAPAFFDVSALQAGQLRDRHSRRATMGRGFIQQTLNRLRLSMQYRKESRSPSGFRTGLFGLRRGPWQFEPSVHRGERTDVLDEGSSLVPRLNLGRTNRLEIR